MSSSGLCGLIYKSARLDYNSGMARTQECAQHVGELVRGGGAAISDGGAPAQLVANIASPLTLIQVKQQLAELRRHQPKPTVSSSHLQGAYVAGVWHNSSTLRSSMCLRLISWIFRNEVLQRMMIERSLKKQKVGKTDTQGR